MLRMTQPTTQPTPDLLTAAEVADTLRVSRSTVARWARDGAIESVRVGRVVRFRRSDIDALLEVDGAAS